MLINFPSKTHLPQPKEKHLAQDVFKSNVKERERENVNQCHALNVVSNITGTVELSINY